MSYQYVELAFENANAQSTENIVMELGNAGIGYEHITGQVGNLVGCIHKELDFETFRSKAESIVHEHNNGMMCKIEKVMYQQIEHLL